MALGYDGKLYILAFDHRGSFQKKMFGIEGDPTPEETETIADAKQLIYEGMEIAVERGVDAERRRACSSTSSSARDIPQRASEHGLKLAMPVEKSGQNEFDFQYGEDFGEHIERRSTRTSPRCSCAQPGRRRGDERAPARPPEGARRLAARATTASSCSSCWCRPSRRPARGGRRRHRPLRRRAAPRADAPRDRADPGLRHRGRHLEDRGRRRARGRRDAGPRRRAPARAARTSICVLLGRGASDDKVDHWLRAGRAGRGLHRLRDRPLDLVGRAQGLPRRRPRARAAAEQIAENYLRFIKVYDDAEVGRARLSCAKTATSRPGAAGRPLASGAHAVRVSSSRRRGRARRWRSPAARATAPRGPPRRGAGRAGRRRRHDPRRGARPARRRCATSASTRRSRSSRARRCSASPSAPARSTQRLSPGRARPAGARRRGARPLRAPARLRLPAATACSSTPRSCAAATRGTLTIPPNVAHAGEFRGLAAHGPRARGADCGRLAAAS